MMNEDPPDSHRLNYEKERIWEHSYLQERCKFLGLERDYNLYQIRLRVSYLSIFLLLHSGLTVFHCTLLLYTCERLNSILVDVFSFGATAVLMICVLSINFKESLLIDRMWIMHVTSVIATFILVFVDIALNVYHFYADDLLLGSFYDTYVIYTIYMFLPIPFIVPPLILGSVVSLLYITYYVKYMAMNYHYELSNFYSYDYVSLDISHYICFNLVGLFFRVMSDIIVRSSFLDRHQYVMEEIMLRSAREREKTLLHSILPPQIAKPIQEDIRDRIAQAKKGIPFKRVLIKRIIAVQIHPEVSILYADVVNYTFLTTQLSVETLVSLLHELYARFDMAASRFNVQRIKFLGDCYYCVGGLTQNTPDHAKRCVDLGFCMIRHIREVRDDYSLDIGMRIGVHSGSIFAGVIGEVKLQYDIWGKDVTIANCLESTGKSGYVHISAATYSLLDNVYPGDPGTEAATTHPYLQKYNIKTYLMEIPEMMELETDYELNVFESLSVMGFLSKHEIEAESSLFSATNLELQDEFKKMPVGGLRLKDLFKREKKKNFKDKKFRNMTTSICLNFRNPSLEWDYMCQPDYMLKYSLLLAWFVGISFIYVQLIDYSGHNILCYFLDILIILSLTVILLICWYKKICLYVFSNQDDHEYSAISCFIFRISEYMQDSLAIRMTVYVYIIISYFLILAIILLDCDRREYEVMRIESILYHYDIDANMCFHPWVVTNMVAVIVGMSFIFSRIPVVVKALVGILETLTYLIIMFYQFEYIMHNSPSTNPYFYAEYSHAVLIVITFITFYLMERQTEFNSKINFNWKVELQNKQRDGNLTHESILILLNNILPSHVANFFMNSDRHELYYEEYDMVAVLFATVHDFYMDLSSIRVLNDIISDFDMLLEKYKEYYMVEKIKIVGCTYMAACGLDIRFSGRVSQNSESIANLFMDRESVGGDSQKSDTHEEVVYVLTLFALDMMRKQQELSMKYKHMSSERTVLDGGISIGIASGKVMAGVVGASQAHYDIWGDPVNMASRMDSTGLAGHIQISEPSANILKEFGVECMWRGMTQIKGRGPMPTYFVQFDEDYNMVRKQQSLRRTRTSVLRVQASLLSIKEEEKANMEDEEDEDENN